MNENILKKAQKIKLFAMDVDGILSDGKIIYNAEGVETKAFYVQDGVGLKALQGIGVELAIITGRRSAMVERRASELGISHVIQGRDDKFTALSKLACNLGVNLDECAYMGDDLPDLKAVREAGLGISVPNGCAETQAVADFITVRYGGDGAVREACELILQARGEFDAFIAQFL
ncbi:HAD hydrolase family protein [Moraxella nasovis]|uniref:KdsC family phosphatase n=1 Tax=Moraxella nasovis TaxID=2904121 RepID=UPI001F61EB34|nr:HAD hydrolase family protein [Moraxella nasovis]UNU73138.1 HAD hydrolase family protein [Moraxella nasovis]